MCNLFIFSDWLELYRKVFMDDLQRKIQAKHRPLYFIRIAGALILLSMLAAGGIYSWHAYYRPCEVNAVQETSKLLINQMKMYDDVYVSAAAAPSRSSTIYPVSVMQKILVDTQQIDVPYCMQTAKGELIGYMGDAIRAFHAYEAQEENAVIKSYLDSSYAHIRVFIQELDDVEACAPSCFP